MHIELFPKRCFTELEAAEYIGMNVTYLRRARTKRTTNDQNIPQPIMHVDGRIRYMREDLDAWLDQIKSKNK